MASPISANASTAATMTPLLLRGRSRKSGLIAEIKIQAMNGRQMTDTAMAAMNTPLSSNPP